MMENSRKRKTFNNENRPVSIISPQQQPGSAIVTAPVDLSLTNSVRELLNSTASPSRNLSSSAAIMVKGGNSSVNNGCATSGSGTSGSPNDIPSPNSSITLVKDSSSSNTNTNSTNASKTGKLSSRQLKQQQRRRESCEIEIQLELSPSSSSQYYNIYDGSKNPTSANLHAYNGKRVNIIDENPNGTLTSCSYSTSTSTTTEIQEFLPVCDALFNVISLAIYFCDIVFDVLTAYSYYVTDGLSQWTILCLLFIFSSLALSQALSYHFYAINARKRGQFLPCSSPLLVLTHFVGCGVLWRYFKLFIPLDMKLVKHKVRDLLLLRLVHGFVESAPMLIIQLYLILLKDSWSAVTDLNLVSTSLSLLSLCWALASFSKNIRSTNVHKLMLTWLGLIFQFGWRLGTITSRVISLTLYATIYHYWILLVICLHWFSMFLWIISPHFHIFSGEKISKSKKYSYSSLLAIVYIFCYINILETNSIVKMAIYYITMFCENMLLVTVWYIAIKLGLEQPLANPWYTESQITWLTIGSFSGGIAFMCLYYRFFHVKKLSYNNNSSNETNNNNTSGGKISGGGGVEDCFISNSNNSASSSLMNGNFEESSPVPSASSSLGISKEHQQQNRAATHGNCANQKLQNNHHNDKNSNGNGKSGRVTMTNKPRSHIASSNSHHKNNGNNNSSFLHGGLLHHQQQQTKRSCEKTANGHHLNYNSNNHNGSGNGNNIQGVFNCRFNPAMKRKKKKPTSFIPPPNLSTTANNNNNSAIAASTPISSVSATRRIENEIIVRRPKIIVPAQNAPTVPDASCNGKMSHPFWKRPAVAATTSNFVPPEQVEALSNILVTPTRQQPSTSADIQQKLYEKKQQQIADLREIEEEQLRQGPSSHSMGESNLFNCSNFSGNNNGYPDHDHGGSNNYSTILPPPYEKKRPWFSSNSSPRTPPLLLPSTRSKPEELILDPSSLASQYHHHHHFHGAHRHSSQQQRNEEDIQDDYEEACRREAADGQADEWNFNNYDAYALDDDLYNHLQSQEEENHLYDQHADEFFNFENEIEQPKPQASAAAAVHSHSKSIMNKRKHRRKIGPSTTPTCQSSSHSALNLVSSLPAGPSFGAGTSTTVAAEVQSSTRVVQSTNHHHHHINNHKNKPTPPLCSRQLFYKSCRRIPSDVESQLSLSRSYTLPREFKYRRKHGGASKQQQQQQYQHQQRLKNEQPLPSTNSSDGDVDSGEDETEIYSHLQKIPLPVPSVHHLHIPNHNNSNGSAEGGHRNIASSSGLLIPPVHETKL